MIWQRWRILVVGTVVLWCCGWLTAAAAQTYTLALVPGAPPVVMSRLWTPVVERVARDSGIELRLKLFDRMAEFERVISKGDPDFIFASPIQAVVAREVQGYIPLVRNNRLVDIGLYVRKDSPVRSLDDLMYKKISFVGNKNICSVYMQHELQHYGKKLEFEREYAGSSRNVVLNVLLGKVDAGAIFTPDLMREAEETRRQLREIIVTPKFPPHPLAAHPRVPAKVREALKSALLALALAPDGPDLLGPLQLDGLVAADYDRDYRALEKIDIKGLTDWGK